MLMNIFFHLLIFCPFIINHNSSFFNSKNKILVRFKLTFPLPFYKLSYEELLVSRSSNQPYKFIHLLNFPNAILFITSVSQKLPNISVTYKLVTYISPDGSSSNCRRYPLWLLVHWHVVHSFTPCVIWKLHRWMCNVVKFMNLCFTNSDWAKMQQNEPKTFIVLKMKVQLITVQ